MKKHSNKKLIIIICIVLVISFFLGIFTESRLQLFSEVFSDKEKLSVEKIKDTEQFLDYNNTLKKISNPQPILNTYTKYVSPISCKNRFMGSPLCVDKNANLLVRSWRYSYNLRGIVEILNKLDGNKTAVIVVHAWGIDDSWGWITPQPAGVVFFGTPEKNAIYHSHIKEVLNPFLKKIRPYVSFIGYSLPGNEDPVRKLLYQSPYTKISELNTISGRKELYKIFNNFTYDGNSIPSSFKIIKGKETYTYFENFKGLDSSANYNNPGFWDLPIPISSNIELKEEDIVFYDNYGYYNLKRYLISRDIEHILLAGYALNRCVKETTAGYENLKKDFNVFIVGDATLATFPAHENPALSTSTFLAEASLNNFITEVSWIEILE